MRDRTEVETSDNPKIDLNQWVVKGTGERRQEYMRREWTPSMRPSWGSQSDATRFYRSEAEAEAIRYSARPVKLVAPKAIVRRVDSLKEFITDHARHAPMRWVLHWIHGVGEIRRSGYTEGDCFCRPCAEKAVDKLRKRFPKRAAEVSLCVDGGYGSDEDGLRYCESCASPLQHSLTSYGVESEFEHFTAYPPKSESASCWDAISIATQNLPSDSPLWVYVARWVDGATSSRKRKR